MLHKWLTETDGTGSAIRVALFDYRKAFDFVHRNLLIAKLFSYGIRPTVVNWITDFLRNRLQRVKISTEGVSNFLQVPAVVPQGTRIGPCLFLTMINDLRINGPPSNSIWKFADDTTISEVILRNMESRLEDTIDQVGNWSNENKFQLNPIKCKELRIDFTRRPITDDRVVLNGERFELVKSAKLLGMTITEDLKWNSHIENIVSKASKRLYLLRQLKRADVDHCSLIQFYCACIRSILEYGCQVFHSSFPEYLSVDIERVRSRALRII